MNKKKELIATAVFLLCLMMILRPGFSQAPIVKIIKADTGLSEIVFPMGTPVGTKFLVNVTVENVENLAGWQVNITWDPTTLNITSEDDMLLPPDHVLQGGLEFPKAIERGTCAWALAVMGPTFNGSGTMMQINFTIINATISDTNRTSPISFALTGDVTSYISDPEADIPATFEDATFVVVPEFGTNIILVAMMVTAVMLAFVLRKTSKKKLVPV